MPHTIYCKFKCRSCSKHSRNKRRKKKELIYISIKVLVLVASNIGYT